jgi:protein-tyrosine phosphatase
VTTRVLFVCTGNICRSAFAQAAAASLAKDPDLVFASAGTHAMENNPATTTMQEAAAELGIDLTAHRSTPLRDSKQPDVVLGMEQQHLVAASRRFPDLDASRIRLLDHPGAIDDPYGLDLAAYQETATHIIRALEAVDFR